MKRKLFFGLLIFSHFISMSISSAQNIPNLPKAVIGTWDLWISGAITYEKKGTDVYQKYQPGTAMARLKIDHDGNYQWGTSAGKLQEVKPWYAENTKRYFRLSDIRNNSYDFWYKQTSDELIFLFGEVGGHAATATRTGTKSVERQKTVPVEPKTNSNKQVTNKTGSAVDQSRPIQKKADFKKNDVVKVLWSGAWYKAKILDVKNNKYLVNYEGWGTLYDEWVTVDRIRNFDPKN